MADKQQFDRNSSLPIYRQLAEELKTRIDSGELKPGEKLESESEMLARYDVGRLTLRNALALLVNEGRLEKAQGKGTFVRERKNASALNIEVLLDMSDTYFMSYYIRGISEVLSKNHSNFIINDTRDDTETLCTLLEKIARHGAAGVIFQYSGFNEDPALENRLRGIIDTLTSQKIPVIILDGKLADADAACITEAESDGGFLAAEHLAAFGHRRCAFLGMDTHRDSFERLAGFRKGLRTFGLPEPQVVSTSRAWEDALLSAVRDGVTAVFAFNDDAAFKCVMMLKKAGLRVPEDVSVVGFDDSHLALASDPPLTSLSHPKEKIGSKAASLMLEMIADPGLCPREIVFDTKLIIRNSCSRPREAE